MIITASVSFVRSIRALRFIASYTGYSTLNSVAAHYSLYLFVEISFNKAQQKWHPPHRHHQYRLARQRAKGSLKTRAQRQNHHRPKSRQRKRKKMANCHRSSHIAKANDNQNPIRHHHHQSLRQLMEALNLSLVQ